MARLNDLPLIVELLVAVTANVAPIGIAVVLIPMRDCRWRFSLPMLLTLTTFVALTLSSWGLLLRHR